MAKKGHLFLENTESRKNRLLCEPQFPESTISTHLGHTTKRASAGSVLRAQCPSAACVG